jgi:hypothetical protein
VARRHAPAPAAASAPTTAAPRPTGLTAAEAARAAEIEAQLLAEERAAEQARKRTRDRTVADREAGPAGALAVRAETEYAYGARRQDIVGSRSSCCRFCRPGW